MERLSALVPRTGPWIVRVSAVIFLASLLISGVSAYVTLAAPLNSPYVPSTVAFYGQLLNDSGSPVADGSYSLTFSLYSQDSGGSALWSETHPNVPVVEGVYSVQLGSVTTPPTGALDGARWLGIKVGTNPEMTPRVPISAVPFALNAMSAQGIQGYPVSTTAPGSGQLLGFDAAANSWGPTTFSAPSVRAYSSSVISIPSNATTWTVLGLNAERWDTTATMHDNATNNSRLVAPQAGKYFIFATVEFAAATAGQRYIDMIWTSGGVAKEIAYEDRDATSSQATRMTLSSVYTLAAGEYVELRVKQNRGSALNVNTSGNYTPEFGMTRVGD